MTPRSRPVSRLRGLRIVAATTLTVLLGLAAAGCASAPASADRSAATVTVTDQWKRTVTVPRDPKRVVVLEWEGLVAKSMQAFGVADRLVAVDKATHEQSFRRAVIPAVAKATKLGTVFSGINYEQLAGMRPDVVLLEAWANDTESRSKHQQVIDKLESLKIPTVVLLSPSNYDQPDLRTAWEIITLTGTVFGKEGQAAAMVSRIEAGITEATRHVPTDGTRPRAAIFATKNYVMGRKSIQSFLLTSVLKAENVVGAGTFVPVSEEKLLTLDPEALVVIGHEGFIPIDAITAGRTLGINWGAVKSMKAITAGRVTSIGYDEWRATVETPVALMKMAKVLYPEAYADIDPAAFELKYYQDVFGLDEAAAAAAVKAQEFAGALGSS